MANPNFFKAFLCALLFGAVASSLTSCKKPDPYDPYTKFDIWRMQGLHNWHTQREFYYHNSSYNFDSLYTLTDTAFRIGILDYKSIYVAGTSMYATNPYTAGSVVIFSSDTTGHDTAQYYKQVLLYYNYATNSVSIKSGVFSNDPGSDSTYDYTEF